MVTTKEVFTEMVLPSYWASYLINNDSSGLDSQDLAECIEHTKGLSFLSVSENEYCARFNGLLTMVANYTVVLNY
jgi:hypothetical protein